MSAAIIDIQQALPNSSAAVLPSSEQLQHWVDTVFKSHATAANELTIRFVGNAESQTLNKDYRGKDKPTNVLSFPFENPPGVILPLLGDLVVCVPVIEAEAQAQKKPLSHHYAHMIVHGCLHLLGYDHIDETEAVAMERLEIAILADLSIDDPYQDH